MPGKDSSFRTHYDNLQVAENASIEVIRGAYKFLSQKWHPDKNPDDKERAARIMKIINDAYVVLSDPERRKQHDEWIRMRREKGQEKHAQGGDGDEEQVHKQKKKTKEDSQEHNEASNDEPSPPNSETNCNSDGEIQLSPINHEWAWAASVVPIVVLLAESLLPPVENYFLYTWVSIGAYVTCCFLDERELKNAGYSAPTAFWAFLVPVYLWRRDTQFSKWRPRFLTWLAALVLATFLDSSQYVLGEEMSGVWTNEQLGNVELALGRDPKTVSLDGVVSKVRFLASSNEQATYVFTSGEWVGEKVTLRKVSSPDGGYTLEIMFFDDPENLFQLGWLRSN